MIYIKCFKKTALVICVMFSTCLSAESLQDEDDFQQKAHLHGRVDMSIVIQGNTVEIQLESPAANIVGFEHLASTEEQRALVAQAQNLLNSPAKIFTFKKTECKAITHVADTSSLLNSSESEHGKEAQQRHHDHTEDNHTGHKKHSEISARYHFNCSQADQLTAINVHLFELFPRIETIHAAWISESKQALTILKADSTMISLKDKS